jgi:transcription termination/antitermination protein NusG
MAKLFLVGSVRGRNTEKSMEGMMLHTVTEAVPVNESASRQILAPQDGASWNVLWARTQCEQEVHDQLTRKGFHVFLPQQEVWRRHNRVRYRAVVPLFPGYLFLRQRLDPASYLELLKTSGLIKVLGDGWDRLACVPDPEVEAVRRLHLAHAQIVPVPYQEFHAGDRVRITQGALSGLEGVLLQTRPSRGLLVVSIHLLQRSVAVEVDCTLVEAA